MSNHAALVTAVRWAKRGLLVLALALAGCGPPTASVSGTVTFKGLSLPSGTVLFHGADGRIEHALIGDQGRYRIVNAPLGPVRITVRAHAAMPTGIPGSGKPPAAPAELAPTAKEQRDGKYVPIPPRYLDPAQSGLTYSVRTGSQEHDIELQP